MSDSEEDTIRRSQDNTHGTIGTKVIVLANATDSGPAAAGEFPQSVAPQAQTPKHQVSVVVNAGPSVDKDGDVNMN